MSRYFVWWIIAAAIPCSLFPAQAQIPESFHYQGRYIKDGSLANATLPVLFELVDAATDGNVLYAESQTLTFIDGFFDAHIGTAATPGTLISAFASKPLFLQITIDGERLTPAEPITSVPCALLASAISGTLDMKGQSICNARYHGDGANLTNLIDYVAIRGNQALYGNYVFSNPLTIDVPLNYGHGPRPTQLILNSAGQDVYIGANHTIPPTSGGIYIGNHITVDSNSRGIAIGSTNAVQADVICIGRKASGTSGGIALGHEAYAGPGGTAVGYDALTSLRAVAIGYKASGDYDGTALGYASAAGCVGHPDTFCRVAIGEYVTNRIPGADSAVIRGSHYADGGTGLYFRATFGSGEWAGLYTDGTNLFFKNTHGASEQLTHL